MLHSSQYAFKRLSSFHTVHHKIIQPRALFPSKVEGQTKTLVLAGMRSVIS